MAQPTRQMIDKMLEDCVHFDPDFKHVAAHDLCQLIEQSTTQLDEGIEKRICSAFMKHLTDTSTTVKSNAVKCIERVSSKIRETNLIVILQTLVKEIVEGQMETIDINSLTVRGIVQKTKEESSNGVFTLIQPLVKCIEQTKENRRREESLDILTDIFKKFALLIHR